MSLNRFPSASWGRPVLAIYAFSALFVGLLLSWIDHEDWASRAWWAGAVVVLAALAVEIVISLRRGHLGLDIIAGLSMSAALAFGEPLAASIVAAMYAGGQQLENYAEGRARHEMTALLGRVAQTAMRYSGDRLEEVAIDLLAPGDVILIRRGEVLPVDGTICDEAADIDMSALTGEPLASRMEPGQAVPSGCLSVGAAFDLKVDRPAADSTYSHIVRLVEKAQQSRAPMVRLADGFALWFLLATVLIAALAWWFSGDRVRALAVLVVATPCPLILAVPVAVISGMSRTAALGVLVKSGGALEMLARVRTAVLDKTGTLTSGKAGIVEIRTIPGADGDEMLRLAASLDQASAHVSAEALVVAAHARGMALANPHDVEETAGSGLSGMVEGRRVTVGGSTFVKMHCPDGDPFDLGEDLPDGTAVVAVGIDGHLAGILVLSDQLRPEAAGSIALMREAGIDRFVLASGDRADITGRIGLLLSFDETFGALMPSDKVEVIRREAARARVIMIGDGVNDAPALAAADVGVAMGARGAAASSETADIVVLVDDLQPLARSIAVAHRTRRIALQSVGVGLGLSFLAMGAAAFGYLPPVQGALLQEVIDVAVIINALRALAPPSAKAGI